MNPAEPKRSSAHSFCSRLRVRGHATACSNLQHMISAFDPGLVNESIEFSHLCAFQRFFSSSLAAQHIALSEALRNLSDMTTRQFTLRLRPCRQTAPVAPKRSPALHSTLFAGPSRNMRAWRPSASCLYAIFSLTGIPSKGCQERTRRDLTRLGSTGNSNNKKDRQCLKGMKYGMNEDERPWRAA
jgi:hypothetical protein